MWERGIRLSRGRISLRLFSLLATSTLMAFFVVLSTPFHTAFAADAIRSGDSLVYANNTYTTVSQNDIPSDIIAKAPSTQGYRYIDAATNKAYFVLTSGDSKTATSGYYVTYDYTAPSMYSNPSPPTNITISDSDATTSGSTSGQDSCDGSTMGGIGWFVCPTVNFLAKGMDKIYGIISDFLIVKTVTADTNTSIYKMWTLIRDIANVCFVIVFLLIVFSQITSMGISNYGIKHMLPRLIIAAILVNVSYWVSALAVDLSNFLGVSVHATFVNIMDAFSAGGNYNGSIPTWEQISAVVLAGGGALAGGIVIAANTIGGTVFLLIPFLLSAMLAALVALLVLAARQALITCLIIISPLAFVAYVLPNTEKYFNKWRETMMTMVLLFPIFSVVFSGAQLAGMVITQNAGGNLFTILLGMAVQVAPIAVTPLLVKFSGGVIGKLAGLVNNPNKGLIDRSRKWSSGMAQEHKNKVLSNRSRLNRLSPFKGRSAKYLDARRRYREKMRKSYETRAENRFDESSRGQLAEAATRSAANDKQNVDNYFAQSARGQQLELQSRNLGVRKQEIENTMLRSDRGHHLTRRQQLAEIDKTNVSNEFEETTLGHEVDRAKRIAETEKRRIGNTHQAEWDNAVQADPELKQLEVRAKASEVTAALAKGSLDKMHAEIAAEGNKSEHIVNLRGRIDQTAYDGMLRIAHGIKTESIETSLTAMAKTAAEHKFNSETNKVLLDNTEIINGRKVRKYAAGIGSEAGVLASAVAKERKEFGEEVSYQKELSNHFKLDAVEIYDLAMGKRSIVRKDEHGRVIHTFDIDDDYVRDMAAEEIFTVGSHNNKLDVLKLTGKDDANYSLRRTIQQAAIRSNISSIAPAINDKTLNAILNGEFSGDEGWQYHSFREVLEGRIKVNALSTANAASLKLLFADVDQNELTKSQFNKLINDNISSELKTLREDNESATEDDARRSLIDKFNAQRDALRSDARRVLTTPTISQNASDESLRVLEKFAGISRDGKRRGKNNA